jgi:hypothetical protein
MSITADKVGVHNGLMNKATTNAIAPASGRGTVTRISSTGRITRTRTDVARAREARRELRPRSERFAHLKRMYD